MTTMTATELARNLSAVLDRLEHSSEEIVVVRHRHPVARLIPGAPRMSAMEAFADLYGAISADEGAAWSRDCAAADRTLTQGVVSAGMSWRCGAKASQSCQTRAGRHRGP
ncbi:MAG: type II toxin-antitoxin system Phd/YefM family antitoxin [Lentisphaerae bacterium]|nr:type II toxin-antitoxin system Phd/YefM family antitoxin [Lentisphaerota bacterium]